LVRRLPPLNALRAFEAAARHLSVTKAAEELGVTPAAVSHQVRALEGTLGLELFQRLKGGLVLTDAGRLYLPGLTEGLDRLARATVQVQGQRLAGVLTVSTLASFATGWLVPRLGDFRACHPDLDVLIRTESRLVDFDREDVDVAIRYGRGSFPGLVAQPLMGEEVFPICSPVLLNTQPYLRKVDDLRHYVLLHDVDAEPHQPWMNWREWLNGTGIDTSRGFRFTDSSVLIAAAVAGQGVALGRSALLGDLLESGHLVRPFEASRRAGWMYFLVAPERHLNRPKVVAFLAWLREAVGRKDSELLRSS